MGRYIYLVQNFCEEENADEESMRSECRDINKLTKRNDSNELFWILRPGLPR